MRLTAAASQVGDSHSTQLRRPPSMALASNGRSMAPIAEVMRQLELTAELGAGQPQFIAQDIDQRSRCIAADLMRDPVHAKRRHSRCCEITFDACCAQHEASAILASRTNGHKSGHPATKHGIIRGSGPHCLRVFDPQNLKMQLRLNGELRQDANTSDMIYGVRDLVSWWSNITLEPGDVITSGAPAGVIAGSEKPVWLKPGDRIEARVEKLGTLVSTIAAEPAS
jgi:hypothetical protein